MLRSPGLGMPGRAGPAGAQGPAGPKGDTGFQGPRGEPGAVGPQGTTGAKGDTGAAGQAGAAGAKGDTGAAASTLLGSITISETIAVAVGAGVRRVTITTPTAWNVKVGDALVVTPTTIPTGAYATHDAVATGPNTVAVGVTTPALALLASYSIAAQLRRLT